jgi:hypothetical protein
MISEDQKLESDGFLTGGSHAADEAPIVHLEAFGPLVRSAKAYATEARARRTREEYAKQWNAFAAWCEQQGPVNHERARLFRRALVSVNGRLH